MKITKTLLAALVAGALAACSNPSEPSQSASPASEEAAKDRVVNLYSSRHYDSDKELYRIFEEKTGIKVNAREAGSSALLETMKAEGASSPADLLLATDAGTLWRFQDAGLLQAVDSAALNSAVPAHFREPNGYWFGLSKRARVIAFDPTKHAAEDFADYAALADAKYEGEICVRSSTNIYNLSLMGELIERWGNEDAASWAAAVQSNFARAPTGGDTTQLEAIAAGECSVAVVNHYYWARLAGNTSEDRRKIAEATQLAFPAGDYGTHVNITGGAVAANAPNKAEAIAFMEFLISPEGQSLLVTETKEFPILADVSPPEVLNALPDFKTSTVPLPMFGENQKKAQINYDKAGWN